MSPLIERKRLYISAGKNLFVTLLFLLLFEFFIFMALTNNLTIAITIMGITTMLFLVFFICYSRRISSYPKDAILERGDTILIREKSETGSSDLVAINVMDIINVEYKKHLLLNVGSIYIFTKEKRYIVKYIVDVEVVCSLLDIVLDEIRFSTHHDEYPPLLITLNDEITYKIVLENSDAALEFSRYIPFDYPIKHVGGNRIESELEFSIDSEADATLVRAAKAGEIYLYNEDTILIFYKDGAINRRLARIGKIETDDDLEPLFQDPNLEIWIDDEE